ncbi:DNA methyltransferase [Candidatus Spongiihabitans sp.]|uniref:DNA methyltransferase n=1 Tax=Candidatus Spongiihabitans sp. TaxID=3101308 RepID=UPI003C7E3B48
MADLNIKPNALFTADNLYVLNGMNSDCIDLIYLDPPFNSKRLYKAPMGSKSAGAAFYDMWTWQDVDAALMSRLTDEHPHLVDYITSIEKSHSKAMMAYIAYMAQRLFEMQRVLKPTGSIYLHCDPTASHYLKVIMDFIFGRINFRNEIIWCYSGPSGAKRNFPAKHDIILRYAKSEEWIFNANKARVPHKRQTVSTGATGMAGGKRSFEEIRKYEALSIKQGKVVEDWWVDIGSGSHIPKQERTGYPTQKPLALLNRIIKASSNEGDVVLDPFCGCATTCVAAQHWHRKWIGIDLSPTTADLIRDRLANDVGELFNAFIHFTDLPNRKDVKYMSKKEAKPLLYGEQGGDCNGCKIHFPIDNFDVDHIIPQSKGGGDFKGNYQLLCGNCNSIKGNRPMEYLITRIEARAAQRSVFGEKSSLRLTKTD